MNQAIELFISKKMWRKRKIQRKKKELNRFANGYCILMIWLLLLLASKRFVILSLIELGFSFWKKKKKSHTFCFKKCALSSTLTWCFVFYLFHSLVIYSVGNEMEKKFELKIRHLTDRMNGFTTALFFLSFLNAKQQLKIRK